MQADEFVDSPVHSPRALVSFKLVRVAVARSRACARPEEGVPSAARARGPIDPDGAGETDAMGDTASARRGGRPAAGRVGIGRGWRHFARSASGSAALVLALLSALVGAAEPAHDDAAHVGGDVYVYDLLPARGLAGGGAAVTLHGSGFNDAMACQFGPRVVPARAVSPEGDRMICVAPPFPRPSGGFIAVGITLTAGADPSRGVTVPRGARSFEYVPAWSTLAARPSEIDAGGGAVLTILGTDLHAAGSCAFEPHPTVRAELHVVSSAMVRCEAPARRPGDGTVTLAPEYVDAADSSSLLDITADAEDRTRAIGVAGVVLTARRPARATSARAETSSSTGAALVVVAGEGFARAVSTAEETPAAADDSATVAADAPSHNGPGCVIGTIWVRASTVDRRAVVCVAPMTWTTGPRRVAVEIRYADQSDPGGGSSRAGRLAPSDVTEGESPRPPGVGMGTVATVAEAERWRAPSVFEVYPREGPGAGGDVAWIFGRNLRGFPAPACVFAGEEDAERDSRVTSAVVVSSALAACERPPAPVWIHDDASRVVGVEFASTLETAARASRDGAAVAAWPSSTATHRATPSAVSSAGGTVVSLSGRGYPPSRGGTTCRFGSVGPVAGTRTVAGDVACVSPALAPGRETRVFGPEGRIDASEAHRAATTIRILDDTSDEARGDADADSIADSIDADSIDRPTSVPDYPTSVLDHPLAFVNPAVTVRAAHPTSILVHEGAMVTVSGTLRGLGVERPVSCTFGAVVVLGRRASDDDAVECVAPDRAPGEARVGVPGAVGHVSVEYTSPLALALDASALVESEIRRAFDFGPDVRGVSPRDVVAGSSASERATVVGSNLVVGDAPVWCVFGDGVATLARRVSSAVVSCDFVAVVAGASRIAAASRTASPRFEFRRGVDLRTAAEMSASARAPCAPGAAVGCATVMYHPTVPETRDASPSTVGEEGGDAVTVAGSGFPGVDDDGCRFGSVGPVHATRVSASSVTCVTPARAPADAVRVAAYGAWSDDALLAFVVENVAPTFASPAVARRVGGTRVRVFGASSSRARRDAECRLGGAEGGTVAVAKTIDASIAWWSCDAPTNRAGDAFQTLFVGGGGGVGTGGGGVPSGAKKVSVASAAPSSIFSFSFVIEYAEDPRGGVGVADIGVHLRRFDRPRGRGARGERVHDGRGRLVASGDVRVRIDGDARGGVVVGDGAVRSTAVHARRSRALRDARGRRRVPRRDGIRGRFERRRPRARPERRRAPRDARRRGVVLVDDVDDHRSRVRTRGHLARVSRGNRRTPRGDVDLDLGGSVRRAGALGTRARTPRARRRDGVHLGRARESAADGSIRRRRDTSRSERDARRTTTRRM